MLYQGLTRRLILTLLPRQIRPQILTLFLTAMQSQVLMLPQLQQAVMQQARLLLRQRLTPPQAARPSRRLLPEPIRLRDR